jgi:large subunit ribosomal protein L27
MATKKAAGSTRLGRDSQPKYLGTKVGHGETVNSGAVLVRQRGTKIRPGKNVRKGADDTLYGVVAGKASFTVKKVIRFDGKMKKQTFVSIIPTK